MGEAGIGGAEKRAGLELAAVHEQLNGLADYDPFIVQADTGYVYGVMWDSLGVDNEDTRPAFTAMVLSPHGEVRQGPQPFVADNITSYLEASSNEVVRLETGVESVLAYVVERLSDSENPPEPVDLELFGDMLDEIEIHSVSSDMDEVPGYTEAIDKYHEATAVAGSELIAAVLRAVEQTETDDEVFKLSADYLLNAAVWHKFNSGEELGPMMVKLRSATLEQGLDQGLDASVLSDALDQIFANNDYTQDLLAS